jgi:chorismate--pyruvate lyase
MLCPSDRDPWLFRPSGAPPQRALRAWLRDPASLTARIRARCSVFSVRLVGEGLAPVQRDEAALFGLRRGSLAWLREVLLLADGVPVVYARSVMPRAALRGGWRRYTGLGGKPLGAALFANPAIRRGALHAARLDRRDARYHRAARVAGVGSARSLWARRSSFELDGRALLVCEIFLPAVVDLPR